MAADDQASVRVPFPAAPEWAVATLASGEIALRLGSATAVIMTRLRVQDDLERTFLAIAPK
jgi:hypothetical protein